MAFRWPALLAGIGRGIGQAGEQVHAARELALKREALAQEAALRREDMAARKAEREFDLAPLIERGILPPSQTTKVRLEALPFLLDQQKTARDEAKRERLAEMAEGLGIQDPVYASPGDLVLGDEEGAGYRPVGFTERLQVGTKPRFTEQQIFGQAARTDPKVLIDYLFKRQNEKRDVSAPYQGSDEQGPGTFVTVTDVSGMPRQFRVGGAQAKPPIQWDPSRPMLDPNDPTKVLRPADPNATRKLMSHDPTKALIDEANPTVDIRAPQPEPKVLSGEQQFAEAARTWLALQDQYGPQDPRTLRARALVDTLKGGTAVAAGGAVRLPSGTTVQGPPAVPPATERAKIVDVDAQIMGLQGLLQMAQTPNVQSVLGGFAANPVGRVRRALSEVWPTLNDEQRTFFARLAGVTEPLKSDLIGAARTAPELLGLIPLIPDPNDFYGMVPKLAELLDGLNRKRGAYENALSQSNIQMPTRPGGPPVPGVPSTAPPRPAGPTVMPQGSPGMPADRDLVIEKDGQQYVLPKGTKMPPGATVIRAR